MPQQSLLADLVDGVIAGVVATLALDAVTGLMYDHENKQAREREDSVRNGTSAYAVAAEKAASIAGRTLTDDEKAAYGTRIHWGLGLSAAALYAALRGRASDSPAANGLLFGALLFLLTDEGAVYALGLSPGPTKFPWQTHARGLLGHLAYGAAANAVLGIVQPTD